MCGIYASADPDTYRSRSRSIRLKGMTTSIRLENQFWDLLAEMAAREGKATSKLIAQLHEEVIERHGEVTNFASFLRVTCLRYQLMNAERSDSPLPQRGRGVGARAPVPQARDGIINAQ